MNALLKREYGLTFALALLTIVFGVVVLVEGNQLNSRLHDRRAEMARPVQPEVVLEELSENDFELPAIDSYVELIERPLFIEGRRPLEEQPGDDRQQLNQSKETRLKAKLMGIYSGSSGITALILNTQGKYIRVKKHDDVDGWQLEGLFPDRVTLKQGCETQNLMLHKPKPKVQKRTRPSRLEKSKSKSKPKLKARRKPKQKKETPADQETSGEEE